MLRVYLLLSSIMIAYPCIIDHHDHRTHAAGAPAA
eukprot:SAG31_NODE_6894_length_1858_cov_2.216600_1_plen_34_part_10